MTALVALGLNENHLVELPPEIGKLTNLQMLGTAVISSLDFSVR